MNAAATAGNRSPAGRWNASCPGTPAPKTSAPGHSRHPPDKTSANNDSTGMATASRHADHRHALSQDFRILTFDRLQRAQDHVVNLLHWHEFLQCLSGIPEVLLVTRRQPWAGPGRGGI